jgi:lysophospholipase L1-like esterase
MSSKHRSIHQAARLGVLTALALGLLSASLAQPPGGRGRGGAFFNRTGEAEVPPAVAMPRPGEAELARAGELFDEFKSGLGNDDRAMLERYPGMLEVELPVNSAIVPSLAAFFRAKHEQNLEVARAGDVELLLMGDSITDFWRNEAGPFAGKPVLDEHFGHWKIANFGIAGDTTQGVLYRLQNGEGEGFSPRAVMLMIGTNNTARNTAAEIAEGVGAVVLELENRFPDAEILLLGIFPRGEAGDPVRDEIAEINGIVSRLDDRDAVHYLDIGDIFLDADGNIPPEVMSDRLHPGPEGYRRWAEAVAAPLSAMMEP